MKCVLKKGLQSKIWASDKFRERLRGGILSRSKKCMERADPEQVIQLKDSNKKLVHYVGEKHIIKMRERLEKYNDFIKGQYITVNLPDPVITDNEFWVNNLLKGLLNGRYSLDGLTLNQEIYPSNANIEDNTNPTGIIHPCRDSSTIIITSTNTPSTLYYRTSNTNTLITHIHNLIHLYSTKEKSSNRLVDKAFMISDEQLCEYFLTWLLFMSKDIRIGKDNNGSAYCHQRQR